VDSVSTLDPRDSGNDGSTERRRDTGLEMLAPRGASSTMRAHERQGTPEAITEDPRFVTIDDRSPFAYVFAPPNESLGADHLTDAAIASVAHALREYQVGTTGIAQLSSGGSPGGSPGGSLGGSGVLVETLVGEAGALAVLVFV